MFILEFCMKVLDICNTVYATQKSGNTYAKQLKLSGSVSSTSNEWLCNTKFPTWKPSLSAADEEPKGTLWDVQDMQTDFNFV